MRFLAVAEQIATPTAQGRYKVHEQGMCEVVTDRVGPEPVKGLGTGSPGRANVDSKSHGDYHEA